MHWRLQLYCYSVALRCWLTRWLCKENCTVRRVKPEKSKYPPWRCERCITWKNNSETTAEKLFTCYWLKERNLKYWSIYSEQNWVQSIDMSRKKVRNNLPVVEVFVKSLCKWRSCSISWTVCWFQNTWRWYGETRAWKHVQGVETRNTSSE